MVLARIEAVLYWEVKRVLTNRVEKDSTLTEVNVAYIVPVDIEIHLSVEKYSFVATRVPVNADIEDNDPPVSVEKFSVIVLREDVTISFTRNVFCERFDDVKKFIPIEGVFVVNTLMVEPIILETTIVLLAIDDTNRDDVTMF